MSAKLATDWQRRFRRKSLNSALFPISGAVRNVFIAKLPAAKSLRKAQRQLRQVLRDRQCADSGKHSGQVGKYPVPACIVHQSGKIGLFFQ